MSTPTFREHAIQVELEHLVGVHGLPSGELVDETYVRGSPKGTLANLRAVHQRLHAAAASQPVAQSVETVGLWVHKAVALYAVARGANEPEVEVGYFESVHPDLFVIQLTVDGQPFVIRVGRP